FRGAALDVGVDNWMGYAGYDGLPGGGSLPGVLLPAKASVLRLARCPAWRREIFICSCRLDAARLAHPGGDNSVPECQAAWRREGCRDAGFCGDSVVARFPDLWPRDCARGGCCLAHAHCHLGYATGGAGEIFDGVP